MLHFLQWFGEQPESVKLALLALFGGFGTAVVGMFKEWRKPVLNASNNTTPTAPRKADDPLLLLVAGVEAANFALATLNATLKQDAEARQDAMKKLEILSERIRDLDMTITIAREVLKRGK